MNSHFDIVAIGELLIDFTPLKAAPGKVAYELNPGGAPANVLVAAQKLGKKTALIAKVGNDIFGKFLKDTVEKLKDSERCVLRTNILRIYNKYLPTGEIPAYEFETLSKDYHSYKGLDGNTFVDDIWEIMSKEWKVIPNGKYR